MNDLTLEYLLKNYKREEFEFFKYNNSNGEPLRQTFIFESQQDYLDKYLQFYKELPNLTEVIVFACDGTFKITNNGLEFFIRHSHQDVFKDSEGNTRGIDLNISKLVRKNLMTRINDILSATSFDQLMTIVKECKVKGFGELSIYDTTLRIAKFKNIEPDKVYLHAGARKGFEVLERKGYIQVGASKKDYLTMNELPEEFQKQLKCYESENVSCLYKSEFEKLPDLK